MRKNVSNWLEQVRLQEKLSTKAKQIKTVKNNWAYLRNSIFTDTLKAIQKILICCSEQVLSNIQIDIYCSSVYISRMPTKKSIQTQGLLWYYKKHKKGIAEDAPHHQFKDIPFNVRNHYIFGFPFLHHEFQDINMDI